MNRRKNGFTLVEMVVTLAVLSILLAVSVFGLIGWQENTRYNKQNEYAQTLFVAAQNQLSEYSRNGTLEKFQKKITAKNGDYSRTLKVEELTNGDGEAYTKSDVWYEGKDKTDASKYQGTICYVSCMEGDYTEYKAGSLSTAAKNRGADVLFDLLSNYVYDESILNNSISVEFSPDEGQVFAVCFKETFKNKGEEGDGGSAVEFVYQGTSQTAEAGRINISRRGEEYRRLHMFGYYGVDTLAKSTSTEGLKPILAEVTLNNEETLNLSFKVLKVAGAATNMNYDLKIYDKDSKNIILSMTIPGNQIRNYEYRGTVTTSVTRYTYDDSGNQSAQSIGDYDILAWIDNDETVRIVFDAADIQATSLQYISDLKSDKLTGDKASEANFASTYSFHRFGVDVDNIYCTIQGSGDYYKTTSLKQSNSEAAYFASVNISEKNNQCTYTLTNGRHLYNVRFVEDINDDTVSTANRFEVSKNIDWNEFVSSGNFYYTTGSVDVTNTEGVTIKDIISSDGNKLISLLTECYFPSIKQLRYGDTFTGNVVGGLEQNNKEIINISISEINNVKCGIYSTATNEGITTASLLAVNEEEQQEETESESSSLEEDRPVGLFVYNYGTITQLNLDGITVTGNKKVGAFCGSNKGELSNLEVKNSDSSNPSVIEGQENVGGIMGYQESLNDAGANGGAASQIEIAYLTNRAKVTGRLYVGGIVGEIHIPSGDDEPSVLIDECKNYGPIVAKNSEALSDSNEEEAKNEPRYLGGIVGYCNNEHKESPEDLKLVNCVSSPQYSEEDLDLFLERDSGSTDDSITNVTDSDYKGENLKGVYVGGIAGYNYFGTIVNCSTEAESGKTGYVFGYKYVGGIVGFNQGPVSGIQGGTNQTTKGVNEANVVGYQYVGGISGCNSDILYTNAGKPDTDAYDVLKPDAETNLGVKISNWENRGIVFAVDSYAGGITGFNAGWLYDCDSKVRNNETSGFFQETYSGDYAGGLSGYNNGIIGKTNREVDEADPSKSTVIEKYDGEVTTVCYVTGHNYVGGIVGYNDVDAIVEDYGIAGGKIKGDGSFVGGYAGLNASLNLLMDKDGNAHNIVSKPNEVSGVYFVGGNIGGNIIDCASVEEDEEVKAEFETNNFFGKISSEAFAGGFIGYNLLINNVSKDAINELQDAILEAFAAIDKTAQNDEDSMKKKIQILDDLNGKLTLTSEVEASSIEMCISGEDGKTTQNRLGQITGKLYLGGVIGYNDKDTYLKIKNVVNTTPIRATMSIEAAEQDEERTKYDGSTFRYSYAGGIIGKNTQHMTIINCSNGAGAGITTQGTYTGGLVEINEGTIESCSVSSIGAAATDYIGGICGLNKSGGTITKCTLQDKTVSGRNYVGGIVAENFGTVSDSIIKNDKNKNLSSNTISAVGINVTVGDSAEKQGIAGCIAAYNAGTIVQSADLVNVKVNSNGNYAGAVVGVNEGIVTNANIGTNGKIDADNYIVITGAVSGDEYVGGIIGVNYGTSSNKNVSGYRNKATVTAEYGEAGGIIGSNNSNIVISYCENAGTVISRQGGDAGGITSENFTSGRIENCTNSGEVSSPNGDCGGIAAKNDKNAYIENCTVKSSGDDLLEITSKEVVGGMAAHNEGYITNPTMINVYVYNYTNSPISYIGVITGKNYSTGVIYLGDEESKDETAVSGCVAKTYTDNSYVGGVSGLNQGKITAPDWYTDVELPEGEEDLKERAFDIPKAWVSCQVGYVNDTVSFGKLGGVSGENQGIIENVGVRESTITGRLGSTTTGTGGIAGVSTAAASGQTAVTDKPIIKNCTFDGNAVASGDNGNVIYLGGIVGLNQEASEIYGCRIGVTGKGTSIDNGGINDKTYGYVGGIAGVSYGDIIACDSYHTDGSSVTVIIQSYQGQVGGVVGLQQSSAHVTGEVNRRLSTGKNWTVAYYSYVNDHALGGVVGSSYSNYSYEYISNYAMAFGTCTKFNMARAGILGRLWPESTNSVNISYCYNYGDVIGKKTITGTDDYTTEGRYGGIIGQLQFGAVTLKSCKNYGTLRGGHYTGGMIGCVYKAYADIELIDCENHGNLYGKDMASATIASRYQVDGGNCEFIFYNCSNTGLIGSSNNTTSRSAFGSISNNNDNNHVITALYSLCQNYGYGISGVNFGGIQSNAGYRVKATNIINCFDFGGSIFSAEDLTGLAGQGNFFMSRDSFTKTTTEKKTSNAQRLNYSDGSLYLGTEPTSITGLTTLSDGTAGSTVYYLGLSDTGNTAYVVGANAKAQNIRYRTWLEMHTKVADYIKSTYCATNIAGKTKLDTPTSVALNYKSNAGYNTITWKSVSQAYSYEVQYTVIENDGEETTYNDEIIGICRVHVDNELLADATNIIIKVRAKDGCDQEGHYSDWAILEETPKQILPTPKYHFELLYNGVNSSKAENLRMIAILDNAEDYIVDGQAIATITIENMGTWTIDPTVGYYALTDPIDTDQKTPKAYAKPKDTNKYVQSPMAVSVSYMAGKTISNSELSGAEFNGFYGDTTGNLEYSVSVKIGTKDSYVAYSTQELMAYDEEVGAVISYAHRETRADFATGSVTLSLSGLPADLTSKDEIVVKNIYWAAQSYVLYAGHEVANNITLKELKSLMDTNFYGLVANEKGQLTKNAEKRDRSIWKADGSLEDGYIVYKNEDGTYSVYYSVLEECQAKLEANTKSRVHTVGGLTEQVYTRSGSDEDDTSVYTDTSGNKISIQPHPVIEDLTQNDDGEYVFTWDVDKDVSSYKDALYDIELVGTTLDGTEVSLDTVENIKWDQTTNKASYTIAPASNWNYKQLTITVSRHGGVKSSNETISFPSASEETFDIKLSLSQIGVPTVSHDADENGNSNMDQMLYDIIWDGVPTSAEQKDLAGYIITVVGSEGTDGENATATHYFYVLNDGSVPQTISDLIDGAEKGGYVVEDVTDGYDTTGETLSAEIDLENYRGGETITVSVKAIAKDDAEVYKDGPEGVEQSQTLPNRLTAPDVEKLTASYENTVTDGVLLVSDLDKGVKLIYKDDDGSASQRLRLAVAVYDEAPDNADKEDTSSDRILEGSDRNTSKWNEGAVKTLISKEAKESMSGNMTYASYDLTLQAGEEWSDYAGKWLKVVLQSTSDSAISSNWSDEDGDALTTNYVWFKLPKAQLDEVNLVEASENQEWTYYEGSWSTETEGSESYITTRTVSFDTQSHADGYRIQLVDNHSNVYWIYIRKNGSAFDVSYAATDVNSLTQETIYTSENQLSPENTYTTYIDSISNGETIVLPYIQEAFAMPGTNNEGAMLTSMLTLDETGNSFTVTLPDVLNYTNDSGTTIIDTGTEYLITKQIAVQAVVYDKLDSEGNSVELNYINSAVDNLSVNETGATNIATIDAVPAAPTTDSLGITVLKPGEKDADDSNTDGTDTGDTDNSGDDTTDVDTDADASDVLEDSSSDSLNTYRFTFEKGLNIVTQLLILDDEGTLTEAHYYSGGFVVPAEIYNDETVTNTVIVRFAQITDSNVSAWTDSYILLKDGSLEELPDISIDAASVNKKDAAQEWQDILEEVQQEEADKYMMSITLDDETENDKSTEEAPETSMGKDKTQAVNEPEQNSTEQTSTEQTSTERTSTEQTSTEQTSTEVTTEDIVDEAVEENTEAGSSTESQNIDTTTEF
jgi:prepilin-type N-terminal cleavage/methylation domain-containing protein